MYIFVQLVERRRTRVIIFFSYICSACVERALNDSIKRETSFDGRNELNFVLVYRIHRSGLKIDFSCAECEICTISGMSDIRIRNTITVSKKPGQESGEESFPIRFERRRVRAFILENILRLCRHTCRRIS